MKKVLFLIHDLGQGGAEKVLVNLVNHMDQSVFDITVMTLFGGGVHEKDLSANIRLQVCHPKNIPGNSHLMKIFTPKQLYHHYIKEHFDILISFLEGPCARIVSGCDEPNTKTIGWIHCTMKNQKVFSEGFRSYREAVRCYSRLDQLIFVSKGVQDAFNSVCPETAKQLVLYNTNDSEKILKLAQEAVTDLDNSQEIRWCGIGKLTWNKGFDRMIRIQKRLKEEGILSHLYILGSGEEEDHLRQLSAELGISESVSFLGFQDNPYKYLSKFDLYVCASHAEGFSTAATEALIVGTPVCTVNVSGMKELLGENNEWGIVTENEDEALFGEIYKYMFNPENFIRYKALAKERGKSFSTEKTVSEVEKVLLSL